MQLQNIHFAGQNLIEAYGDMGFRMNQRRIEGSILILPGVVKSLDVNAQTDFDLNLLAPVFAVMDEIEIMILGTGATQKFPSMELKKPFLENNIALEAMDTGAACRTYNILVSEDRRVAAALIAI
jgi:uncharacterized protein